MLKSSGLLCKSHPGMSIISKALKQHITETQKVNISLAKCIRVVYVGEQKSEWKFSYYFVRSTEEGDRAV